MDAYCKDLKNPTECTTYPLYSALTSQFVGPGGRLSDNTPVMIMFQSHERPISPALDVNNPASKNQKMIPSHIGVFADGSVPNNVSYAAMAGHEPNPHGKSNISSSLSDDDIVVLEDDYVIDQFGKIPSIKFSNHVHEQIDNSMRNTIIVRLLGRSIGFRTLQTSCGVYGRSKETCGSQDGRGQYDLSLDTKEGTARVVPPESSEGGISKNERSGVDNGSGNSANSGSRFTALLVEDGVDAQEKSLPVVDANNNKGPKVISNPPRILQNDAYMKSNPTKKSKEVGHRDDKVTSTQIRVDKDVVIISQDDVGSLDRHTAITLMESKYDSLGSTRGKIVKAWGHAGRVSKEGHRRGLSFKKPLEVQSRSQQSLVGWLSNLSQQLELPIPDENLGADGVTGLSKFGDGHGPPVGEHTIVDNEDSSQPTHSDPIGGPTSLEQ
ncbi:hypothetical protein V6N11_082667 [Hibiscus sabdariffa]|uniref:Uncharacterized protein n=1 Tax=Hibiscus sabdariffa TaxID=183260 RepID=A0ABR2PA59_9ROSI